MQTEITSVQELKELFIEILMDSSDKVSKISKGSTVNGIAYACGKIGQKAMKDIAIAEAHRLPSSASGSYLDSAGGDYGFPARYGVLGSSMFLRLVADPGTVYDKDVNTFRGTTDIIFELEDDFTMGVLGWDFVKVRSTSVGSKTNVDPNAINSVDNAPVGHQYVTNDFRAFGGRDVEADPEFRVRIKNGANIAARSTLGSITQAFMKINSNVLNVVPYGTNDSGKSRLAVISQNGSDFTDSEFGDILEKGEEFVCLSDMRPFGVASYGIELVNPSWVYADLDFRCKIHPNYTADSVRKEIQIRLSKYLDFRYWKPYSKIEWDDMLQIVKSTPGVEYVPDTHFSPREDISVDRYSLPRIRGFIMRDLDGVIVSDISGVINPVYFPVSPDSDYINVVLESV